MQGRSITSIILITSMIMAGTFFTLAHQELRADVIEFSPEIDTTLYEDDAGRFGNGAGQYLFAGRTWDQNGIDKLLRRALVKFDLGSIPAGSVINSASFSITIDQVPPAATSAIMSLQMVTSAWGEGASNAPGPEGRGAIAQANDATWLHTFYDTGLWTTPGGDFAAEIVASKEISSSPQAVTFASSPQMVTAVQAWVDDPSSNYGWVLRGDEVFEKNARRILSRENTRPGTPLLTIDFTPAPPASIPSLTITGLLLLVFALLLLGRVFLPRTSK